MYERPTAVSPSSWIVPECGVCTTWSQRPCSRSIAARISSWLTNALSMWHPPRAVLCEQRREAVLVAHHRGVGELAAQRLDLEAVSDGLKVAHRLLPSSAPSGCRCGSSRTRPDPFGIGRNRLRRADARVPSGSWPPLAADDDQERGRTVLILDQRVHPVPPARWPSGLSPWTTRESGASERTPLVAPLSPGCGRLCRRPPDACCGRRMKVKGSAATFLGVGSVGDGSRRGGRSPPVGPGSSPPGAGGRLLAVFAHAGVPPSAVGVVRRR